jgi:glutathione S-transferase
MSTETITISAFKWVPPFAQGLVRDLRVRWALEEVGVGYEQQLITPADQKSESYRKQQPFGQVPTFEASDVGPIFESGAIVLHIAAQSSVLMPTSMTARAQACCWLFAALNTVEPPITMLNFVDFGAGNTPETAKLRETVLERIAIRLDEVSAFLGDRSYLVDDRFTVADLMMVAVLRILRRTELVKRRPKLAAYVARCEERPAFQRALAAQMKNFEENAPLQAPASTAKS